MFMLEEQSDVSHHCSTWAGEILVQKETPWH